MLEKRKAAESDLTDARNAVQETPVMIPEIEPAQRPQTIPPEPSKSSQEAAIYKNVPSTLAQPIKRLKIIPPTPPSPSSKKSNQTLQGGNVGLSADLMKRGVRVSSTRSSQRLKKTPQPNNPTHQDSQNAGELESLREEDNDTMHGFSQ
jgi:hypothetical protein